MGDIRDVLDQPAVVTLNRWVVLLWEIPWIFFGWLVLALAAVQLTGGLSVACWVLLVKGVVGFAVGLGKGLR